MTNLAITYIKLKYGNATREDWKNLMIAAGKEIKAIKATKSDVFARYPGVQVLALPARGSRGLPL